MILSQSVHWCNLSCRTLIMQNDLETLLIWVEQRRNISSMIGNPNIKNSLYKRKKSQKLIFELKVHITDLISSITILISHQLSLTSVSSLYPILLKQLAKLDGYVSPVIRYAGLWFSKLDVCRFSPCKTNWCGSYEAQDQVKSIYDDSWPLHDDRWEILTTIMSTRIIIYLCAPYKEIKLFRLNPQAT